MVNRKFQFRKFKRISSKREPSELKLSIGPESLLPLEKIIELGKAFGVDFGKGNAKERIRYLTKLGILPNAQRRAIFEQDSSTSTICGHLPDWTIKRLLHINKLYQSGMSYPQIAENIKTTSIEEKLQEFRLLHQNSHQTPLKPPLKNLAVVASFSLIVILTVFVGFKLPHNSQVLGAHQENKLAQTTQDLIAFCKNLVIK